MDRDRYRPRSVIHLGSLNDSARFGDSPGIVSTKLQEVGIDNAPSFALRFGLTKIVSGLAWIPAKREAEIPPKAAARHGPSLVEWPTVWGI